ncbi:MAG: TonB-dependent receptor [Nitrosomonadales bacterium]|nr:MAG: TonB-dependent receptor [Nitrosomonadales bacterium]
MLNVKPISRIVAVLCAGAMGGAFADTIPGVAQKMDEVVVTSTTIDDRFASKRDEPSSVHVISGQTVDEKRPENMIQILQSIPGVTADLSSGDEIKIKLRGIENQRYMGEKPGVAIVIDGVPVFERTGKVNIDLDNIESIRVIKGGASYLFGEDALVGAVIITTKRGAKYKGLTFGADAGAYGYNRQLARAGFANDWGSGHIQVTERQSDDYYWQSGYKTSYMDGNLRMFLSDTSDLTFGFEKSGRLKDKHGSVKGATQAELDPTGSIGRDYTRKYDVELQKLNMTYSNDLTATSNILAMAYEYRDHTSFWSSPQRVAANGQAISDSSPGGQELYTTNNDYHQIQRGMKGEWRASSGGLGWLTGVDLRRNKYENFNTARVDYCTKVDFSFPYTCSAANLVKAGEVFTDSVTDEAVNAIYGELKFVPAPRWTLTANGRYDNLALDYATDKTREITTPFTRSKSFNVTSWRGGANYAVSNDMDLFGNISTGFRAPTAEQLYNGSISPTSTKVANNENLRPEQAINMELGARSRTSLFGIPIEVESAVYQVDRKDYIMSTVGQYSTSTTTAQEMYDNIGGVRNRGFELSLKSDRKREYTLDMAYSYIRAIFTDYENYYQTLGSPYVPSPTLAHFNNTGKSVPRVPRHSLNTTAGWQPNERFRLALEMDAKSWSWADEINQEKQPGRTLFHLHANYDIRDKGPLGAKWSLFARVDNLFDRKYWSIARGTNDAADYLTGNYDKVYNANDLSIVVGRPRSWTAGVSATF